MNQYLESWLKLEEVFSPNFENMKSLDPREGINWINIEQIELGAALAAGCALLEQAGLKGSSKHIEIIFELRNAFIHNGFDISKNRKNTAFSDAKSYLENQEYSTLLMPIDNYPYYSLDGSIITLKQGIIGAIRMCLK